MLLSFTKPNALFDTYQRRPRTVMDAPLALGARSALFFSCTQCRFTGNLLLSLIVRSHGTGVTDVNCTSCYNNNNNNNNKLIMKLTAEKPTSYLQF